MRNFKLKTAGTALVVVLALTLVLTVAFASTGGVALADNTPNGEKIGEFSVAHISDIHYFPLEYCYQDTSAEDYISSDFYQSTTVDTKLVLESGNILYANIMRMIDMAKAGTLPNYVFATGDLTKNGERVAHRDVANSLRYLQNEVRKLGGKYANFQIFATVGNHDLYNGSGALYDKNTGDGWDAEGVTTAQWALMYNGLGYPTVDEATLNQIYPADYWSSEFTDGYIATTIADNLTLHYLNEHFQKAHDENLAGTPLSYEKLLEEYVAIGDGFSQLSVNVDIANSSYKLIIADATLREETDELVPAKVSKDEFDILTNNGANFGDYEFHLTEGDGLVINSKPATLDEVNSAFSAGKSVYRNTKLSHLCGGTLRPELLEFIADFASTATATDGIGEATFIACFHQNLLPHFEVEDDILKDFTFYNWEYIAKFLSEYGVRYSLSGHQHSSDVMSYTDAEGRTVYDMQTGSFVSLDSPLRVFSVERYNVDGKLAEKADSSLYLLDAHKETPLKATPSNHVYTTAPWNETAYQNAITAYNNATDKDSAWQDVLNANPNYLVYSIKHDDFDTLSYNQYSFQEVYEILIDKVLGHFLNEDFLLGTLNGLFDGLLGPDSPSLQLAGFLNLDPYKPVLYKMINYLVDTLWTGLYEDKDGNGYGDYEHNGVVYDNVLDWVSAVADDIIGLDFGSEELGKLTLGDMAVYIFTSACSGNEVYSNLELPEGKYSEDSPLFVANSPYDNEYRIRFQAAIKDLASQGDSGELIERLLSALLDPLFMDDDSLLKTLLTYKFDFTSTEAGLTTEDLDNFNKLIKALGTFGIKATADNFVLAEVINGALPFLNSLLLSDLLGFEIETDDIIGFLEGFLNDYLVDSFYKGLGGIAKYIVVSYGSDDTPDLADINDPAKPLTLQPYPYGDDLVINGGTVITYLSGTPSSTTPVTTTNGRLPGNLTANFDTVDGDSTFTFSFYTAEEVFAKVEYRKKGDSNWTAVDGRHWSIFDETDRAKYVGANNNLYGKVVDGDVTIVTTTAPQYIPLIDLGLLCITHGATYYENEEGEEIYLSALDRFGVLDNSVIFWNRHVVTIGGLDAGAEYEYRVYGTYYNTKGELVDEFFHADDKGEAKIFSFETAKTDGDFEFLAVSDPQGMIQAMYDQTKDAFDTINSSSKTNGYDFIINAGDMVDSGKNFYQWQYALNTMIDTYANTSMFFASGNHENGSFAVDKFFNYTRPDDAELNGYGEHLQDYYSFDYASGHFIVLDTNDASQKGLGKKQLAWLEDDLASTDKEHIFVIMHKSLYSTGAHANDVEVVAMREQLTELFDEYGVDMVFGGHDHVYAETMPIGDSGTIYVTLGTVGTKFYEYTNDNEDVKDQLDYDKSYAHTLNEQMVGYVKVVDGVIYYNGYSIGQLKAIKAYEDSNLAQHHPATPAEIASAIQLPEGYVLGIEVEGKYYDNIYDVKTSGETSAKLYAISSTGHKYYLGDVVLAGANVTVIAIACTVSIVAGVGAIVGGVLGAKKRKAKLATSEGEATEGEDQNA